MNAAVSAQEKKGLSMKAKRNLLGYVFATPAILFFLVFVVLPFCIAFYLSFTQYDLFSSTVIGWQNYKNLFHDSLFGKSLLNILFYAVLCVPLTVFCSLLCAMLLNTKLRGTKIFRALYYLPTVTSAVASGVVWLWLLNPNYGLLNSMLGALGIPAVHWLTNSRIAMLSIVLVSLWMNIGSNMVIFLAALQGLPASVYESARLDGASKVRTFFSITLPLLKSAIYFVMTMTIIGAFQLYDQVFVLTSGGPANATITPVYLIWDNAFSATKGAQAGYAAAQSVVLFLIIMVVNLITKRFSKDN